MGEVYEARHARLAGRYAVKVIRRDVVALSEMAVKRFHREAEITSTLRHPNIVQIIDFNQTADGSPYIVMEYLDGIDLETRIRRRGPMSIGEALPIIEQIASALAAAHGHGVIHRDLKPQNILLVSLSASLPGQPTEFVKVVDFGISKATSAETLTGAPIVMGTPHYMAPEQARAMGEEIDGRADQFALGAITYELLSGRKAFPGDTVTAVIYNVVHEPADSIAAIVGPALDAAVQTALAKERGARYPSMTAYVAGLRAAAGAGGGTGTQLYEGAPSPTMQPRFDAASLPGGTPPGMSPRMPTAAPRTQTATTPSPSDAETVHAAPGKRRPGALLLAALALLLAGGGTAVVLSQRSKPSTGPGPDVTAAAQMIGASVKQALEGERQTLAATVRAAAQVTELHNAAGSHIDAVTFKDLFETEDWWQPYRALAVAVFEGDRLLASNRVSADNAAGWLFWRGKETAATELVTAAGQPPHVAAGIPFGAKTDTRKGAAFGLVLARPLDAGTLAELAKRAGATLLIASDGKRAIASSAAGDVGGTAVAPALVGREAQPLVALPDGRAAVPVPVAPSLWLWSVAPPSGTR